MEGVEMKISDEVRKYLVQAMNEKLDRTRPDYGQKAREEVIAASIKIRELHVTNEIFIRAIEMAIKDQVHENH